MVLLDYIALSAADLIWQSQAVRTDQKQPIRLVGGNFTPIYIDMRVFLAAPVTMDLLISLAMRKLYGPGGVCLFPSVLAGLETAGALFACALSVKMRIPCTVVRKTVKSHGVDEGIFGFTSFGELRPPIDAVLLVDDTTTDGKSKIPAINILRAAGAAVDHCFTFVDRQQGAAELLTDYNCGLVSLVNMDQLLQVGVQQGYLSSSNLEQIQVYLQNPREWHLRNGLPWVSS